MKKVITLIIAFISLNITLAQETEPNDDPGSSNTAILGDTIKGIISPSDVADFFLIEIPEAGLLHLDIERIPEFSATWWVFILDAESDGNPEITKANLYWNTGIKSISVHVLAGKYYIKIGQAAGEINYWIYPTLTLPVLAEDAENNDVPDSSLVWDGNSLITGNLRYYNPGVGFDMEDWYRFELAEPSRLHLDITDDPESWTYWWLYLLDGEQEELPVVGQADLYWNSGINSLTRALLEGTYYIKISDAAGIVNYRVEPTHTFPEWPGEMEPNNELSAATELTLNDTITGLIRYYDPGIGQDIEDWYQMNIPGPGLLKMDIYNAEENANFWVYLKDGNQEGTPNIQSIQFYWLDGNRHKHVEQRLDSGTYYLQFANADRGLSYQVISEFIRDPVAGFEYTQVNNSVLFNNLSQHVSKYLWEFGDEIQSEVMNPLHEYEDPGVYEVCLTVNNEAGMDQLCKEVVVEGLASVYPNEAGNTGDATLTIYGGGFDSDCVITIEVKGEQLIRQDTILLIRQDAIQGRFDLRGFNTGLYDIKVETPSGNEYILEDAFTIEEGTRPDPWVEVSGRNRMLLNTPTNYTIRYGNNGNVDASMVHIWLAFSDIPDMEIDFTGAVFIETGSEPDSFLIDENPDPELTFFTTDRVLGEDFQARIYPLILPVIPANTTHEFTIKIKTAENIKIISWANEPMFQSPWNKNNEFCLAALLTENYFSALPSLDDNAIGCILKTYAKTFHNIYELKGTDGVIESLLFVQNPDAKQLVSAMKSIHKLFKKCAGSVYSELDSKEAAQVVMKTMIAETTTSTDSLAACFRPKPKPECDETSRSISLTENDDCITCGTFCPFNICEFIIQVVASFDPNEKDQPAGYSEENYTFLRKTIPYTIYFENLDSATAPAHVVRVVDSLDAEKFDFSTLHFGSVTIGDSSYYAEKGFNEMIMDIPLEHLNVVARVEGKFDTLTGVLEWTFQSLDPSTLESIEDPDVGFLPPNVDKPEGEGHVTFQIDLKQGLDNMDVIQNQALIYFDANDPIKTNVSTFALDLNVPSSKVDDLDMETSDTLILIEWGGRDLESGVRSYDVYYSKDNGDVTSWKRRTSLTADYFDADPGSIYRFFSVAIDSVGNEEPFPDSWDAETFISTSTNDEELYNYGINLFPNPCYGSLKVEMELDKRGDIEWFITNALGTKVIHQPFHQVTSGYHGFNVNLNHHPGGVYFLNIRVDDRYVTRKFVLIN